MKDIGGTLQLSASEVATLSACRHLITLEVDALRGKRTRATSYSAVTTRLITLGDEHERRYFEELLRTGKSFADVRGYLSQDDSLARTQGAMREGVDVIYQGALHSAGWFGRADFLVRVDTPSKLGTYSYEAVDTKLAFEAKARAVIQLCLYSQLLETAQGVLPESMHIVLGNGAVQRFRTRSYLAYYRRLSSSVRLEISAAPASTYPAPIEYCDVCTWQTHCERQLRNDDDLSLVANLTSRQREQFRARGISTVEALGGLDAAVSVDGISAPTLERLREQARVQCDGRRSGRVIFELLPETEPNRGLLALPAPSVGDLFVDIEGDPLAMEGGIEYLIGVTEAGPVHRRFTAFWGTDRAGEKRAFEEFMQFVKTRRASDPNLHLYHYAPYEPAAFKRLAARHNTCVEELDDLLRSKVFVDLFRVVRQGVRASVESYSIKKMEPLYGFSRKANLRDAGSCLVAMATWFDRHHVGDPPPDLMATIAAYNEDDCASALELRDWLELRRQELEAKHETRLSRPPPGDVASEEQAQRIAEVDVVTSELSASIPEHENERTPEQQAKWLLAQLLDWHRRENKSKWWEYYRQCELSDEELVEDSTTLGGLVHDAEVGKEKRSKLHRYRYPAQECTIDFRDELIDPRTGENAGEMFALDESARILTLKRGPSFVGRAHPTALVSKDSFTPKEQKAALMRLGRWVATNGMSSTLGDYRSERALLRRAPPILPDGVRIADASTSEQIAEVGKQLALAINGSVLPVQGPPGAGKTYLGAEMIVAVVSAGKRVGIVANSHTVIGKLLQDACKAAERHGVLLRCVQKTADDTPVHAFVTNMDSNADVLEAIHGGAQVVAGTSWLWAREEMRNAVDLLFVDEAGQISLANVLASAQGANGLVLLGDPQQLDQPLRGVHPPGADVSALAHVLGDCVTLDADSGIFLGETWRMHPDVCTYISEAFYEGKLNSRADLSVQTIHAPGILGGTGLRFVPVEHNGNTSESIEEALCIGKLVAELLASSPKWTNEYGRTFALEPKHALVLTPYNAQVAELRAQLPAGVTAGTVDKFQGQEAPIAIYSLATSSPGDAPRGMEFLYSKNRLNVAISRARCVSVLVGSLAHFRVQCRTPRQMELANAFCRFWELAGIAQ